MESFYTNKKLFSRVFSKLEQEYILGAQNLDVRFERMAGKIATKEAVSKAFGVGIGEELSWLDIQTDHTKSGKPVVIKTEKIEKLLKQHNLSDIDISISHMDDYATAVCIVF